MMRKLAYLLLLIVIAVPATAQIRGANGIKKGHWKPSDRPEGYKIYKIGRYEFQSNVSADRVKRIAKHLNAMFRTYMKMFPSTRTPTGRFVVKVFSNRQEFLDYGAPPGAGAYYSWVDKEMVGYDTGLMDGEFDPTKNAGVTGQSAAESVADMVKKRFTMDTIGAFAHEGWHQYFHWYCTSKIEFPSWCDEGIGEYYYPTKVNQKTGKVSLGAPNTYRLDRIRAAIKRNKHIPLKDLVTFNQRKYYRIAGLAYAEGWSLVHFFMEHPKYKKKRYVQRFVRTFADKHSIKKAVQAVFGRMKWEKVEADWKEWVLSLEDPSKDAIEKARQREIEEQLKKGEISMDEIPPGIREKLEEARRRALEKLGEKSAGGKGEKPAGETGKKPEKAAGTKSAAGGGR